MRPEELERELRAERPQVDPDFARKLDDWAAAGFPRGGELGPRPDRIRGLITAGRDGRATRKRTFRPQRWLAPAGGVALLLALVVGISSLQTVDTDDASLDAGGGADSAGEAPAIQGDSAAENAAPPAQSVPENADAGGGQVLRESRRDLSLGFGGNRTSARPSHGKIAQNVDLALATAPEDFRDTADGVLDVVDDHRGFVLRSSVSGGDPGVEGARQGLATFEIRVPAGQLQAAIASLSDLGHVVSRTDGTVDITSRFDSAKRRIATYTEARDRLLRRLEDAVTETEQDAIRAQLRIVEAQLDAAQDDLGAAQQRVHLVPVTVTVSSDESVTGGDGDWDLGDALDDAAKVLTVAGGVLLITAAVLLPLAILVAVGWLIADRASRRARERTLDT
jgi:Domain of unknown function (DUF4349)